MVFAFSVTMFVCLFVKKNLSKISQQLRLLTFIKLPFVIKIFVLSIFEWQFYTGFTILITMSSKQG